MNADPDIAFLADLRLPRVQSHAHLDLGSLRPLVRGQVALGINSRRDCVGGRPERDEERVALGIDDPPVVGGDRGAEQATVLGEDLVVAVAPELFEQSGRPFDVREEEGDRACRKVPQPR
jgi:hypothetical protein